MKKLIFTLLFLAGILNAYSTNVSGGIYSNTTWTLANSPYIVTDTVVVFAGITLTIQPGVTIKFADNKLLEIRQAQLIALGTSADSITFTSNSSSPTAGIFSGIFLNGGTMVSKFSYCNFKYAKCGIRTTVADSLFLNNTKFSYNQTGVQYNGNSNNQFAIVDNCIFDHNTAFGLNFTHLIYETFNKCHFSNNGTGLNSLYCHCVAKKCIFEYNQCGLSSEYMTLDSSDISHNSTGICSVTENKIKHCNIDSNNVIGISANLDSIVDCHIEHSNIGIKTAVSVIMHDTIEYNTTANIIDDIMGLYGGSQIINNVIQYSAIGIDTIVEDFVITKNIIENNNYGIILKNSNTAIYCNKICNTNLDLLYLTTSYISAAHNYWCTADSASTEAVIYDGYDNINYGLVTIMPLDTSHCYLNQTCSAYFYLYPDSMTQHTYYAVNLASGIPPISYIWSWGDGTFDYTPYPSHTYSSAGFYTICLSITDSTGCTSTHCDSSYLTKNTNTMIYVNVIHATGVPEISNAKSFSIFPNPANDNITIEAAAGMKKTISIYNMQGWLLLHQFMLKSSEEINISQFAKGMYIIMLWNNNGVAVKKFIKE